MHHAMNGEYAGFFDIGMVQRNEDNAIIVHGTMCLIRRAALEAAGGWSSDTICEDTDLGLTMLELGWHAHYTNRRYGHGLLPDTFEAYKKQRHRWAYGGFQIVKKHWRRFLPGASRPDPRPEARIRARLAQLARRRKRSASLVAILNLVWVPVVAFAGIAIPDKILTLPILAAFVVSLVHFVALYRLRVSNSGRPGRSRDDRRHVGAMDRRARRRLRRDQGSPALHAHRQGRHRAPGAGFPGFLGGGVRRTIGRRRRRRWSLPTMKHVREINIFAVVLLVQSAAVSRQPRLALCGGHRTLSRLTSSPTGLRAAAVRSPAVADCRRNWRQRARRSTVPGYAVHAAGERIDAQQMAAP